MAHTLTDGLTAWIQDQAPNWQWPLPEPPEEDAAVQKSKQGYGLRILLDFVFSGVDTLRVSWAEVTPPGGSTYYPALREMTDITSFSDWMQIPDASITLDSGDRKHEALFDGQMRSMVDIQNDYDFTGVTVTPRFWVEGMPDSEAYEINLLIVRPPIEFVETGIKMRVVGAQRALPDVLGKLVDEADLPNVEPADIGKIFPIVLGDAKKVRGIHAVSAATTVLEGFIDDNDTTITVADTSLFGNSGDFKIGDEIISYTGKTATTFTGCSRPKPASGTAAANHFTGDQVIEQIAETWVFSGIEAKAFGTIYDPNGNPVTADATDVANGALIAGETMATATFNTPPEIDVIEGGTSFIDYGLTANLGDSNCIDPEFACRDNGTFDEDNYANLLGAAGTKRLAGDFNPSAVEDLGEIVKVAVGVRHYGFGNNTANISAYINGFGSLGNLAKGTPDDAAAVEADVDGTASTSGTALVNTDIQHQHLRQFEAWGTATNPTDAADGDCNGWVTAVAADCNCNGTNLKRPIWKTNLLSDQGNQTSSVSYHLRSVSNETMEVLWDRPGSIGDTRLKIKRIRPILAHGTDSDSQIFVFRVRILNSIINATIKTINPQSSRTIVDPFPNGLDISSYGYTINDLHDSTSRLEIAPQGTPACGVIGIWFAYMIVECTEEIDPDTSSDRSGSGSASGTGPVTASLASKKKTWGVVEEFFTVPTAQIGDWDDLVGKQFRIEGAPTGGSEVWIRELFVRIEYRKRRKEKAKWLAADLQGAPDDGAGTYTGTPNALIENPADLIGFILIEIMSVPAARVDLTYNATQRASYVADGHTLAGAVVEAIDSIKFLQKFLLESRARFWLEQDKMRMKYMPLVEAASTFTFDTSNIVRSPSAAQSPVKAEVMDLSIVQNRISLVFGRDYTKEPQNIRIPGKFPGRFAPTSTDQYAKMKIGEDATSISNHGEKRHEYQLDFLNSTEGTVVQGIADLLVNKYIDARTKFKFEATFESLAVAVDDVVTLNWPTLPNADNVLCRVVSERFFAGKPAGKAAPKKRYEIIKLFAAEVPP